MGKNREKDVISAILAGVAVTAIALWFIDRSRKKSDAGSVLLGLGVLAGLTALKKAVDSNVPVVYEKEGLLYRLEDGKETPVKKIESRRRKLPVAEFELA